MSFQPPSKGELIDLVRRLYDPNYIAPLEDLAEGLGMDPYYAQAVQTGRVGEAVAITTQAYYLRPHSTQIRPEAAGQRPAVGAVEVSRVGSTIGPITLAQGVEIESVALGPDGEEVIGPIFQVSTEVTLASGSPGPEMVQVVAERVGYQGNLPAGRLTRFKVRGTADVTATTEADNTLRDNGAPDRFSPAQVNQYLRFTSGPNSATFPRRILSVNQGDPTSTAQVDGPPLVVSAVAQGVRVMEYADLGLVLEQPLPTVDGRHGWLDAIGQDRAIGRRLGEDDDAYRKRIVSLPDVVSPNAVLRAAARILTPLGINFELRETRDVPGGLGGVIWDYSPFDFGDICENGWVLVDLQSSTRFFVLCVGIGNQGEFGAPYDATNAIPIGNAWDNLFFDGYPVGYNAAIAALWETINATRAAGIGWMLVRDADL